MTNFKVKQYFPPLFKRDTKGKIRVWCMQLGVDDNGAAAHRTVAGLEDGEKVTSIWKEVRGKNVGRSNETTAVEQAESEIQSKYTKQRDRGHFDDRNNVDNFTMFKPMLADKVENRGIDWSRTLYSQPKLDGMRCIARTDGLWSRSFKPIVSTPHIFDTLKESSLSWKLRPDVVLDGELYNHALKDDFEKLMSLCRKSKPTTSDLIESAEKVEYHVYDIYDPQNPDMPFRDRIYMAEVMVKQLQAQGITCIQFVETHEVEDDVEMDRLWDKWANDGYEGQMLRYDTPYENKRSRHLLKRKVWQDEEFPVTAMMEGTGNWSGAAKNFEILLPNGETMTPAVKGSRDVLTRLLESGKTPDWAKVEFDDWTADGSLRFPRVIDYGYGVRDD